MFMIISKSLSVIFLDPVSLTLLILAVGVLFAVVLRKPKVSAILLICGFSLLFVLSSPVVSHFLMRGLEGQYPPSLSYKPADAVVLLGGSVIGKIPPRIYVETNRDANRIFHAARVFRQSGSPALVLTGGIVEVISAEIVPEADNMSELLSELFGIDSADMLLERESQNTRENAVFTKRMMDSVGLGRDIILVTSAYHMPRSAAIFRKAGFTVTPAPTGYFMHDFINAKPIALLPNAVALSESSIAIREYFGLLVYKIMGWI
jgi:uncharacterized SAM-binding protein YcdF (DUF218 family)